MHLWKVAFAAGVFVCGVRAASAENLTSRFGVFSTDPDNVLLFRGAPVVPRVAGNSGLSFIKTFEFGQSDVVLVQDTGGVACPAQFYFVTATAEGAVATSAFGTCTDEIKSQVSADIITVTMGGFQGPSEPAAAQAQAAKEQHVFTFAHGQVGETTSARSEVVLPKAHSAVSGAVGLSFDQPLNEQTVTFPPKPGQPERQEVHCTSYPTFMVRQVHWGDDIGSSVSIIPITSEARAQCVSEKSRGEKDLPANGDFAGAVGRFLLIDWPDGANGGTSFTVVDAQTTKKIYTDVYKSGFDRLSRDAVDGVLTMGFERVVTAPCSLMEPACWSRFGREAKLPLEISKRGPPVAICTAAYANDKENRGDPTNSSVISYPVVLMLSANGTTKVLSRGNLSCWPAE